ncbi:ATPase WRNIP1 [Osmia lignaria lignaria]|uniref:ATPase WRNIP1 n=1 Tax=Osmia lignaria lignaria TaxID=1437193 RepID=UPI00402B886C
MELLLILLISHTFKTESKKKCEDQTECVKLKTLFWNQNMLCPLCRKEYSLEEITSHLDLCFASLDVTLRNTSSTLKRSYPKEECDERNLPKKHKGISTMDVINMNQSKAMPNKDQFPLAETMRPTCLDNYIGQQHVIGSNTVLQQLLTKGCIPSMIFWGPPGCGKSSLANVISNLSKEIHGSKVHVIKLSATSSGVSSIRDIVNKAKNGSKLNHETIVFMDEIHRFNKLQQDIFLPHVEAGTFTLIGTTTENPSYSLNSALLSRCRVFALNKLTPKNIVEILCKAILSIGGEIYDSQNQRLSNNLQNKVGVSFKPCFSINKTIIDWLAEVCDGDARVALNGLELAVKTKILDAPNPLHGASITLDDVKDSLKQAHMLSDRQSKNTHHLYSALNKSIKAGNANAALYWLARIMAIKEDPVDIARRLVRISSENVGLMDPDALGIAVHTMHGCEMIGMPECDVILAECVVYLARAPKSQLVYNALESAKDFIMNYKGPQPTVPIHIKDRSSQRKLQIIFGHDEKHLVHKEERGQSYLPPDLQHIDFFQDTS